LDLTNNEFSLAAVDEAEALSEIARIPELTGQHEAAQAHVDAADAVFKELDAANNELDTAYSALQPKASSEAIELHNLDLANNHEIIQNFDAVNIEELSSQYRRRHDSYAQTVRAIALIAEVLKPELGVKKWTAKIESMAWQSTVLALRAEESHVTTIQQMLPAIQSQGRVLIHAGAATRALRAEAKQAELSLAEARNRLRTIELEFDAVKASHCCNIVPSLPR
jgi:hypothetical protein